MEFLWLDKQNYMTTRIKTDKNRNFLEVEGEQDFVKKLNERN